METNYTLVGTSTTTSFVLAGLTIGNNYVYKVKAVNFAGAGAFSVPSDFIIAAKVPDQPVNLIRLFADNKFITVGWSAPVFDGGTPVFGYKVLWDRG